MRLRLARAAQTPYRGPAFSIRDSDTADQGTRDTIGIDHRLAAQAVASMPAG